MNTLLRQTGLILRNDLRLLWRDLRTGKARMFTNATMIVLALLALHAIALLAFFQLRHAPPLGAEAGAWAFFGFLMLGGSMNHAISLFFERADFDLLLASPVQPRAVLLARLVTMAAGAMLSAAIFLLPVLNGIAIGFSAKYLFGYIVWIELAAIVSSAGIWGTLSLVGWLGPRRARVWVQIFAALLGASVYLVFQAQNFMPKETKLAFLSGLVRFVDASGLNQVARAGHGEPLPLLLLSAIAAAFVAITTRQLARVFLRGLQESSVRATVRKGPISAYRFTGGIGLVTFKKDLRLIVRDPLLLSQILPSIIYVLPAFFGLRKFGTITVLAPITVVIAMQFSSLLAHVAASGEECMDLIRMSPSPEIRLRLAKLAAGMALPIVISLILSIVIAALGRPWLALLTFAVGAWTAAGSAWLDVTLVNPTPRNDILKRRGAGRKFSIGRSLLIAGLMISSCGGISMIAHGAWWIVGSVLIGASALVSLGCFVLVSPVAYEGESAPASWKPQPATTS